MLRLFNTLTRTKEEFKSLAPGRVRMYACGMTVYDHTHIGHMRKYTNDDILRRTLEYLGYSVNHVMNVTDVGHLTSNADEGEDKLEKGALREGKTVWEIVRMYEKEFFEVLGELNILSPTIICRATEHINDQITLIKKLEEKGYTYETREAVYFDISKFSEYGKLTGQRLEEKAIGAREEVYVDPQKKNPADFALWFKRVGRFARHSMYWDSLWGEGFPGWHIECSAMSMKYLGDTFDIHTGGVDHIAVHHTNEIAQSEAATGKPFVRFWIHSEFLLVDNTKMSKSLQNFYTLNDVKTHNILPLALRYLFLTAHYRTKLNFTWEALVGAQNALTNLYDAIREYDEPAIGCAEYEQRFLQALEDDLNTPQALSVMWEVIKSDYPSKAKKATLLKMNKVLGLGLDKISREKLIIPEEVQKLVQEREQARRSEDYAKADELRDQIERIGFRIEDTPQGPKIQK